MSKPDFDIRYDRRVSEEFLSHFQEEGFAHPLVTLAKAARFPIDLQLRKDPKRGTEHATLYVGLTSVLDVRRVKGGLVLDAHATHRRVGEFDHSWATAAPAEDWAERWVDIEMYLERVIPLATQSHGRVEGAVQAAIAAHPSVSRVVIDREVTPSFRDRKTKKAILDDCQAPILRALREADLGFGSVPKSLGNECDALALDTEGRIQAIEIKPLKGGSIAWVAAQALMYARILQAWLDKDDTPGDGPLAVLAGMARQRNAIGLAPALDPAFADPLLVVPTVAVQRGARPEMVRRMLAVRDALTDGDFGVAPVEIYEVSIVGELIPLDEARAKDGTPRRGGLDYITRENRRGIAWKASSPDLPAEARASGRLRSRGGNEVDVPYCLPREFAAHNLLPDVREDALRLFKELRIPWHQSANGGPSPHLRSSQVQCVNALGRMTTDPARIVAAFGQHLDIAEVLDFGVIDAEEKGRYLTFEFIGPHDYFDEGKGKQRTRGSQCTSVDAAFAYRTSTGATELALVEWKYSERYPHPAKDAADKEPERLRRYRDSLLDGDGPVRTELVGLGDLLHEPIYQLVRQQLLAHRLEQDPDVAADVVRVVHVLSPDNRAYDASYVADPLRGLGETVTEIWQGLLRVPDRFVKLDPAVFLDPTVTSEAYRLRYGVDLA